MDTVEWINLTPHEVRISNVEEEKEFTVIPPSGTVARVEYEPREEHSVRCGNLIVSAPKPKRVVGLPGPYEDWCNVCAMTGGFCGMCGGGFWHHDWDVFYPKGDPHPYTIYIVSRIVKQSVPERDDVVVPDDLIRDDDGNIIGCGRFSL